jgi:hypothetical protein
MAKSVEIKVEKNLEHISVDSLEPLQGELKTLSEANHTKLRKSMLEKGFKLSLHVWKNGGVNYLIDGHQRVHVLKKMQDEGIEIPPIPCVIVQARTYSEAKETVLLAVSQYGKLNKTGFQDFIEGEDFEIDDFDFPDFDLSTLDISEPNYDLLNDVDDSDIDDMKREVKKAIQIEFEFEDYEKAQALCKEARLRGIYIGEILMEALENEKN